MKPTLLNATCVETWIANYPVTNLTESNNITKICEYHPPPPDSPSGMIYPSGVLTFIAVAVIVSIIAHIAKKHLLYRLRLVPSYELHQTVEDLYERGLTSKSKKFIYKHLWRG
jgi:hypothetical protein